MAQGEGAPGLEAGEVGRREHAEHLPGGIDDDDVVGAVVEHLDDRVDRDPVGPDLHCGLDDARDRILRRHLSGDHAGAQHGVGEDREVSAVPHEDRRPVVGRHQLGGAPDRDRTLAEERGTRDELADPNRAELRHRMDDVARLHEPRAERTGEMLGAGGPRVERERGVARHEQAGGVLARPDGERRGEPAQRRRLAEHLARAEQVDDLPVVEELDRALADDVDVLRRRAVLEQDRSARLVPPLLDPGCDRRQLAGLERVERRELDEEAGELVCVHRLHCSTSIPVLPVPCNKRLVLPASGRQHHSRQGGLDVVAG